MPSSLGVARIEPLCKDNYEAWKIHVQALLIKNDLWEYVSGSMKIPELTGADAASVATKQAEHALWVKNDLKARSELILAIHSSELQHVRGCATSREVWLKLESIYASKGPARKALLLKQLMLHKLSEGGDVRDYINKFFDIVDRLSAMEVDVNKDLLSVMLLNGLPDSYEGFKCAMESRDELLGVELLKVKILEKNEVESHAVVEVAGTAGTGTQRSSKPSSNKNKSRGNVFKGKCFKCGKKGHKSPDCSLKQNKYETKNKDRQCGQASDDTFAAYHGEAAVKTECQRPWILDSGCTTHLCGDRQLFKSFDGRTSGSINLASQACSQVRGKGTVNLTVDNGNALRSVDFAQTLFVPELRANLVSVSKITDKSHKVLFQKDSALIMDLEGNIKLKAERRGDLYYIIQGHKATGTAGVVEDKANIELLKWHCRMGHLNARDLIQVINQSTKSKISSKQSMGLSECEVCLRGKMTRLPFPTSERQSKELLEIVHSDIVGPFRTQTMNGARYFITFVDDRSRWCEVFFLKHKSGVLEAFKLYQAYAERSTGKKIKCLQSDNGREYCSNDVEIYLRSQGIERRLSVVRTPQQNGVAERINRTLIDMARCLLLQSRLSHMFWADAIATACHIRNRSPSSSLKGRSPYHRWFKKEKIPLNYLRVFGATVFVHDNDLTKGKLAARSLKGIFIGYPRETKGYRVWLPDKRKSIVARDVKFIEDDVIKTMKDQGVKWNVDFDLEEEKQPWVELEEKSNERAETTASTPDNISLHPPVSELHEPALRGRGRPRLLRTGSRGRPKKVFSSARRNDEMGSVSRHRDVYNDGDGADSQDAGNNDRADLEQDVFVGVAEVTLKDAMASPESDEWKKAIVAEIKSLLKNNTWDIVSRPQGQSMVGSRIVLTNKYGSSGSIERRKARIVAKGYSQKYGENYNQTFAPVARMESMRLLLALSAELKLHIRQFDVVTAYLNAELEETVYMEVPDMLPQSLKYIMDDTQVTDDIRGKATKMLKSLEQGGDACKLNKALYGLKQAGRQWHVKLSSKLKQIGLTPAKVENCLYHARRGKDILLLLIYVDDFLVASSNLGWIEEVKSKLQEDFEIKDLGPAKLCLGLEINQTKNYISVSQSRYILNLLDKYNMENCNSVKTPAELPSKTNSRYVNEETFHWPYRELIGALMYLVVGTRPDIANTVSRLAQFVEKPRKEDWLAAKRVLRYLAGTKDLGLVYKKTDKPMHGYCDADWGGCVYDRRSFSGYGFLLAGAAVSWKSQKQRTVALSSTESEYVSLSEAVKEAIYLTGLLREIGMEKFSQLKIFNDNRGAEQLATNPMFHARTKHIDIRHHFVREAVLNKLVTICHVPTGEMIADVLTKSLPRVLHQRCVDGLGLSNCNEKQLLS